MMTKSFPRHRYIQIIFSVILFIGLITGCSTTSDPTPTHELVPYRLIVKESGADKVIPNAEVTIFLSGSGASYFGTTKADGLVTIDIPSVHIGQTADVTIEAIRYETKSRELNLLNRAKPQEVTLKPETKTSPPPTPEPSPVPTLVVTNNTPTAIAPATPPTETPIAINTDTPTPTETPTPPPTTTTSSPTHTPLPISTLTPTVTIIETATIPLLTVTPPLITSPPLTTIPSTNYHPPNLISPEPNVNTISKQTTFKWTWEGSDLAANEAFEVQLGREVENLNGAYDAKETKNDMVITPEGEYSLTFALDGAYAFNGNGTYYWTVAIVSLEPYEIIAKAPSRPITISILGGGGDNGGTNGSSGGDDLPAPGN